MDNDHVSNVTCEQGKIVNDGSRQMLVFASVPGLKETLDSADLSKVSDQLTVRDDVVMECDVKDYESISMKEETKMKDQNCIFCKIANGEIPSNTVYEDENFRVILDLSPASKGHALILPKEHAENLFTLPEETAQAAILVAKKVGAAMMEALPCTGLNLVQNNGASAGQTVMHFHLHLIPRYDGDGAMVQWEPHSSDPAEQEQIAEKIREALA